MSCNKSSTFGPLPAWSIKSTSTWLFHPVSTFEDSTGLTHARPTLEVSQSSGAVKGRPAYRYANDPANPDQPVALDAANNTQVNNGTKFGTYVDVQANSKLVIQWGVEVCNDSGTSVEMAMFTLRIDRKG
jgi:hypothetical protein